MLDLMISEIRKAERLANKVTGKTDCRVTGYYTDNKKDDFGFITVKCEICSNNMEDREDDVILSICTWDRRRTFAD